MNQTRRVAWKRGDSEEARSSREWLVTNGLGGYASGTAAGVPTRRFHGLLVAALPVPRGRLMLLNDVTEEVRVGDDRFELGRGDALAQLVFDLGLPSWQSEYRGVRIEKRLVLPHGQNTTVLSYRVVGAPAPVTLILRAWFHIRPHEGPLDQARTPGYPLRAIGHGQEIETGTDMGPLRVAMTGGPSRLVLDGGSVRKVAFAVEKERGYDGEEELWSPGFYEVEIEPGAEATFVASAETWDRIEAMSLGEVRHAESERRERLIAQAEPFACERVSSDLILAADQFVIEPQSRQADAARAMATGGKPSTIIAGYHWFTDWGRDTMISLEGLTLVTGRWADAKAILLTFARFVKDGLLPNLFPEGEGAGLYHTADATMWFFHAVHRYVSVTGDRETLAHLLPTLEDIVAHHVRGTRFGIGVDPLDGLLRQGADGYQLTWMDAKVGDWVVTPRRGKAVEINALYYNALRLLAGWVREGGRAGAADEIDGHAARARASFNARFWYRAGGYLFDVVDGPDGDDASLRPNQILAISLDHPVLDVARWLPVLDVVQRALVTPFGLRTLAPGHPDYKPRYTGDLRARDAAYHQGTVWAWLIGPYLDAHRKVRPEDAAARAELLSGFFLHLGEACIGSISEIFDAEPPYAPRGCIAQAWSVAEVVRSLVAG